MNVTKEFFSYITKYGLSKSNRFEIEFLPPAKVVELAQQHNLLRGGINITKQLSLMCEASEIPSYSLSTLETKTNGDYHKLPYDAIYSDIPFTFNLNDRMDEKKILDVWFSVIFDKENHISSYYEDYVVDVIVHQLDRFDKRIYSVKLVNAFPVTMNSLSIGNTETNTTHKLNVQFAFSKWVALDSSGQEYLLDLKTLKGGAKSIGRSLGNSFINGVMNGFTGNQDSSGNLLTNSVSGFINNSGAKNVMSSIGNSVNNLVSNVSNNQLTASVVGNITGAFDMFKDSSNSSDVGRLGGIFDNINNNAQSNTNIPSNDRGLINTFNNDTQKSIKNIRNTG